MNRRFYGKKDNVNAGFTDEEKLAMAERAKELASIRKKRSKPNPEDSEKEVVLKISKWMNLIG
jgi:hypothetical protein